MTQPDIWDKYRRQRSLNLFAFVGYGPVVFGIALLSQHLFATLTPALVTAFAWVTLFAIIRNTLRFTCPRCGKWFFEKSCYHILARRCAHCGLAAYADLAGEPRQ